MLHVAEVHLEDLEVAPHVLHVVEEVAYALVEDEAPHFVAVEDEEVLAHDDGVVEARALHLQIVHYGGALEVVLFEEKHVDGALVVVVLDSSVHVVDEAHGA